MRRALLPWLVALGIAVLATASTVAVLNATVFGAGAFVRVYLDAVSRGDVTEALSLPGVRAGGAGASTALLRDGTTEPLRDIRQTGDEVRGDTHLITVAWRTTGGSGSTAFRVERVGTRFGLFPEWGFAVSPTATVAVTAAHDPRFTVNGVEERSVARGAAVDYAVLVPGAYAFGHLSRYLTASPTVVVADTVGRRASATVDARANTVFVSMVATLVHRHLVACTTQKVLFPTGCPFGQAVADRVAGAPAWTLVHPPTIAVVPGTAFGTWAIPSTPATAHLVVAVTSLFDGSTSTFDQDVPFRVAASIGLGPGDTVTVTER